MIHPSPQSFLNAPPPSLALVEPDAAAWDAFVDAHPHGSLLQRSGWGEFKGRFGWEPRRLAVYGPSGILAGAQLLLKRKFGTAAGYVPRGPLLSGEPEADHLLLAALRRLCRRSRAIFLRIEPNVLEDDLRASDLHTLLLMAEFQPSEPLQPRSSVHLGLSPEPDALLAAMSKGHRADIRRSAREGVSVRVGASEADLDVFYAVMQATSTRASFAIHSREYYQTFLQIFGAKGSARLLLAEQGGGCVATAIVAATPQAGVYLYSGSTEAGLKSGAQHAIQWHALQWAREQGCAVYDFWGVPDALGRAAAAQDETEREQLEAAARADPLHGVYRFKKGFGGRVVRYMPAYDQVYVPALYALWRRRMQ